MLTLEPVASFCWASLGLREADAFKVKGSAGLRWYHPSRTETTGPEKSAKASRDDNKNMSDIMMETMAPSFC